MTIEEAIKTAIEYEIKVESVYREAMEKAPDDIGKRVFRVLADEERDHVAYLKVKLDEWQKTGKATPEALKTAIPTKEKIEEGIGKLEKRMSTEDRGVELDMLKKAFEVEKETGDFYKRMVSELPPEGKKLFSGFLAIEEGHLAIVQAEIDALSGMGFWFDFQEINLEAY